MKYVQEFRNPQKKPRDFLHEIEALGEQITQDRPGPVKIMEVCGGHTHSIFKYGLESLLPAYR